MRLDTFFPKGESPSARADPLPEHHAIVVDTCGVAARIRLSILPDGILRSCDGFMIEETKQVIKPCQHFAFPTDLSEVPDGHLLFARLKCNYAARGSQAMVFRIGLSASNGFCIPSRDVVDKVYVVVPTAIQPENSRW